MFSGHTDNVRSLLINRDGSQILSGSSDGTIRLWSIAQQQCIATVRVHSGGVWTLQSDDGFNSCFSAGKDHCVYYTDLLRTEESVLVCEESAPILKICLMPDKESLWIATSESDIKNWVRTNLVVGLDF